MFYLTRRMFFSIFLTTVFLTSTGPSLASLNGGLPGGNPAVAAAYAIALVVAQQVMQQVQPAAQAEALQAEAQQQEWRLVQRRGRQDASKKPKRNKGLGKGCKPIQQPGKSGKK